VRTSRARGGPPKAPRPAEAVARRRRAGLTRARPRRPRSPRSVTGKDDIFHAYRWLTTWAAVSIKFREVAHAADGSAVAVVDLAARPRLLPPPLALRGQGHILLRFGASPEDGRPVIVEQEEHLSLFSLLRTLPPLQWAVEGVFAPLAGRAVVLAGSLADGLRDTYAHRGGLKGVAAELMPGLMGGGTASPGVDAARRLTTPAMGQTTAAPTAATMAAPATTAQAAPGTAPAAGMAGRTY
jgi:hypothetical protein